MRTIYCGYLCEKERLSLYQGVSEWVQKPWHNLFWQIICLISPLCRLAPPHWRLLVGTRGVKHRQAGVKATEKSLIRVPYLDDFGDLKIESMLGTQISFASYTKSILWIQMIWCHSMTPEHLYRQCWVQSIYTATCIRNFIVPPTADTIWRL